MANLCILGDTHGNWASLDWAMSQNPDADLFVHVGDFGYWNNLGKAIPDFDRPILFVDGNHEWHDGLAATVAGGNLEVAKNVFYIPRASHFVYEGVRFNCIGGADSIDKANRTEGRDWFPTEVPSYGEFADFANLPAADIIISHTAPISVIRQCFPYTLFPGFSKVEDSLEMIYQQLDYTPKYHFFGHWHFPMDKVINGTRFMCLPCTHRWKFGSYVVDPSSGFVINT